MTLRYIGKAARKNAQVCRHDKTRSVASGTGARLPDAA